MEVAMQNKMNISLKLAPLEAFIDEIANNGLPMFSSEWKRFFDIHSWEDASLLFDKLDRDSLRKLQDHLIQDVAVCQVFADVFATQPGQANDPKEQWKDDAALVGDGESCDVIDSED